MIKQCECGKNFKCRHKNEKKYCSRDCYLKFRIVSPICKSKEFAKLQSNKMNKVWQTKREQMLEHLHNRKNDKEFCNNVSKRRTEEWQNPIQREKRMKTHYSLKQHNRNLPEEERQKRKLENIRRLKNYRDNETDEQRSYRYKKYREAMIRGLSKRIIDGEMKPQIGKYETQILNNLEKCFNYTIKRQYKVDGYFIDGYCASLNLAIEIDEKHHINNYHKDKIREENIKKELNCTFLRIPTEVYNGSI